MSQKYGNDLSMAYFIHIKIVELSSFTRHSGLLKKTVLLRCIPSDMLIPCASFPTTFVSMDLSSNSSNVTMDVCKMERFRAPNDAYGDRCHRCNVIVFMNY